MDWWWLLWCCSCWMYDYFGIILCLVLGVLGAYDSNYGLRREFVVTGFVGEDVVLPCEVDTANCGNVYFITWARNITGEWQRVYLYSGFFESSVGNVTKPERVTFHLRNDSAQLWIRSLAPSDEGIYKCDVTYVRGKCPALSFTQLLTLVTPGEPKIRVNGQEVRNSTMKNPFQEGALVALECSSFGGRPRPDVTWWNGTHLLRGKTTASTQGEDSTTAVTTTVRFLLSRWDLKSRFQCRVESNATTRPFISWVDFNIQVRPLSLHVRSPLIPVVAGEMVSLTCTVEGARPAAVITWYNRSQVVDPHPTTTSEMMRDSTYRTTSTLVFIASRHDHQADFICKASNLVMEMKKEEPLMQATKLEVLYPPAVSLRPSGRIIVKESDGCEIVCYFDANPPNMTEITWYKDGIPLLLEELVSRAEVTLHPSPKLRFHNVSRRDSGSYTCHLKNAFGRGNATNDLYVDVIYAPTVQIRVIPSVVHESFESSVSISCIAVDGNPRELSHIRWFQNGNLFRESSTSTTITLEPITRHQAANYSCQGRNQADWSLLSNQTQLVVYYRPGRGTISQLEEKAVKGRPLNLACHLESPGNPAAMVYQWKFQDSLLAANESKLTIPSFDVVHRGSYSCAAINAIGIGESAMFHLKGKAPPSFVKGLPEKGGILRNSSLLSLFCHVECEPLCSIEWLQNNNPIKESDVFQVEQTIELPNPSKHLFGGVSSVLIWNASFVPFSEYDHDNFSCSSSSNDVGQGVTSTMVFRVEYPPEHVQLSVDYLEVLEGEVPSDVICSALASPSESYEWTVNNSVIAHGPVLSFNSSFLRHNAGNYTCVVKNRHGKAEAVLFISVLYRPECRLGDEYIAGGKVALSCEAHGRPPVNNFTWYKNNITLSEVVVKSEPAKSLLMVPLEVADGSYSCVAGNALGYSETCILHMSYIVYSPSGWSQLIFQEGSLAIVISIIAAILFTVILLMFAVIGLVIKRAKTSIQVANLELNEMHNSNGRQEVGSHCSSPLLSLTTFGLEKSLFMDTKSIGDKDAENKHLLGDDYFMRPNVNNQCRES